MRIKQAAALAAVIAGVAYALAHYYYVGWSDGYITATGWPLEDD